jgi:ribulose-phosphate 3-epimerase
MAINKHIIPAVIAHNQIELDQMVDKIKNFAKIVMLDLMDGKFVEAHSLDFHMKLTNNLRYQLHIMAINPLERLKSIPEQVDTVILHVETIENICEAIRLTRKIGLKLFMALNPDTPISTIEPYLESLDGVLIMSVYPGQYGAKFLPNQLNKVRRLRKLTQSLNIEVDGGMNDQTIGLAIAAGANMIASGSFIMKSKDPEASYNILNFYF